jgi:hypothetical protein
VLVAECRSASNDPRVVDWLAHDSGSKKSKVRDLVSQKTGGQDDRWLFLPAAPTIPHLVVDFQRLRSLPTTELESMHRVGSLTSPFAEAAVNRFGRYYGRIGTDDVDAAELMTQLREHSPKQPNSEQGAFNRDWSLGTRSA